MLKTLREWFAPLQSIAAELRKLRELYEAELGQREHPVFLVTERPRKSDTEVTYTGEEQERKPLWKRGWFSE